MIFPSFNCSNINSLSNNKVLLVKVMNVQILMLVIFLFCCPFYCEACVYASQ